MQMGTFTFLLVPDELGKLLLASLAFSYLLRHGVTCQYRAQPMLGGYADF